MTTLQTPALFWPSSAVTTAAPTPGTAQHSPAVQLIV